MMRQLGFRHAGAMAKAVAKRRLVLLTLTPTIVRKAAAHRLMLVTTMLLTRIDSPEGFAP
jgi:hypothetical protein